MVAGGPRRWLDAVRERHPLSLHEVSLSLAADAPPDPAQLDRLARLAARASSRRWCPSAWPGRPGTAATTPTCCHFPAPTRRWRASPPTSRAQDALGRRIAVENPRTICASTADGCERDRLPGRTRPAHRLRPAAGREQCACGRAQSRCDAAAYLDAFPAHAIMEIHLAGHSRDGAGSGLLIDSRDAPVDAAVWALYERADRPHRPAPHPDRARRRHPALRRAAGRDPRRAGEIPDALEAWRQ